jgi:hypothetical protein
MSKEPKAEPMSELRRQVWAEMDEFHRQYVARTNRQRPKVVVSGGEIVSDVDVTVSGADVNATGGRSRVVVRRPRQEFVTINMQAYAEQRVEREAARRRDRELDPCNLGIYGRDDDGE